jgi:hypothetical protein
VLASAHSLIGSGRHALTTSKRQQLGLYLGDLRDIRSLLVILISRYQDDPEQLTHLVGLLSHVDNTIDAYAAPSSSPAPSSAPLPSSSTTSAAEVTAPSEEMVFLRKSLRVSQLHHLADDFEPSAGEAMSDTQAVLEALEAEFGSDSETESDDDGNEAAPSSPPQDAAPATSSSADFGTCPLCWEEMTSLNSSAPLPCEHRLCNGCLEEYLRVQIGDGNVLQVTCPFQNCQVQFEEDDIAASVSAGDFQRYQQMLFLAQIRQDPTARWCPHPGCETVLHLDPQLGPTQALECRVCGTSSCASCGKAPHPRLTCEKAEKRQERQEQRMLGKRRTKEKKESIKEMKRSGFTKCPGCRAIVEKSSGCNHMTCRCGREFCYICGETIIQTDLHYLTSACAGLQFSDVTELTTTAKVAQYARYAALPVVAVAAVGAAALALSVVPVGAAIYGVYALTKKVQQSNRRRRFQRERKRQQRRLADFQQGRIAPTIALPSSPIGDKGPLYRFVIVGRSGTGRTTLISTLISHTESPLMYSTALEVDGRPCFLELYDYEFDWSRLSAEISHLWYVIFMYDITDLTSFEQLEDLLTTSSIMSTLGSRASSSILVGNKVDQPESLCQVTHERGQALADQLGIAFREISALNGPDACSVFATIIQRASTLSMPTSQPGHPSLSPSNHPE